MSCGDCRYLGRLANRHGAAMYALDATAHKLVVAASTEEQLRATIRHLSFKVRTACTIATKALEEETPHEHLRDIVHLLSRGIR